MKAQEGLPIVYKSTHHPNIDSKWPSGKIMKSDMMCWKGFSTADIPIV